MITTLHVIIVPVGRLNIARRTLIEEKIHENLHVPHRA